MTNRHDHRRTLAANAKLNPGPSSILRNYDAPNPDMRSILRNAVIYDDITDRCVNCGSTEHEIMGGLCHPCFEDYAADMAVDR